MLGLMQDTPLTTNWIFDRGRQYYGTKTVTTRTATGLERQTFSDIAAETRIKVGLENVENRFLLSPRDWMTFLDEVASPWVRMYFDVGNVVYLGLGWPE